MVAIITANIESLKALGLRVLWDKDDLRVSPVQTALWMRDASAALWHQSSSNEAGAMLGKKGFGLAALFNYLSRRFPGFYVNPISADSDERGDPVLEAGLSEKRIFGLLLTFGDFSHIGQGRYILRETRMIQIAPDWARIAGGLNIQDSDLPESTANNIAGRSLGRVISIANSEDLWPRSELSPLMVTKDRLRTLDEWVAPIISAITEKPAFDLSEASFYTKRAGSNAFPCWEVTPRHTGLCLCKFNKNNYLLANLSAGNCSATAYCEVDGNNRKLLEHHFRYIWGFGTPAKLRRDDGILELQLTFSLPWNFQTEFQAASAVFHLDSEGKWIKTFFFPEAVSPLVFSLLNILGIKTLP